MSGRLAAVFVLLLTILLPNSAQAQYETETGPLEVSDPTLDPGDPVTVSGSGFEPGSRVVITIESTPETLGSVEVGTGGRISTAIRIPTDIAPGAHTLKATGVTPDGATRVLSFEITILGASGGLAGTGGNIWSVAALGGALLALAAAAMWAVRRKARA